MRTCTIYQWSAKLFFKILYWLTTRIVIIGRENVPVDKNFIAVCNHTSYLDPTLAGAFVPGWFFYQLAKVELFSSPPVAAIMRYLGGIPVNRKKPRPSSIKRALRVIKSGYPLLIFPEGRRTPTEKVLEFKPGAAYFIEKTGLPVLPIRILGAENVWSTKMKLPRLCKKIIIIFGKLQEVEFDTTLKRKERYKMVMEHLRQKVIDLKRCVKKT